MRDVVQGTLESRTCDIIEERAPIYVAQDEPCASYPCIEPVTRRSKQTRPPVPFHHGEQHECRQKEECYRNGDEIQHGDASDARKRILARREARELRDLDALAEFLRSLRDEVTDLLGLVLDVRLVHEDHVLEV